MLTVSRREVRNVFASLTMMVYYVLKDEELETVFQFNGLVLCIQFFGMFSD